MSDLKSVICKTCLKEFQIKPYRTRTYCSKSCKNKDPELVSKSNQKRRETWETVYGGHPMGIPEVQAKHQSSMIDRYGTAHALQSDTLQDRARQTRLERYGDPNYSNKSKANQTKLKKYGSVNNHQKRTLTALQKRFSQYLNIEILNLYQHEMITGNKYDIRCTTCGRIWQCTLMNNYHPQCSKCSTRYIRTSKGHQEILDFLQLQLPDVEILVNSRVLSTKFELDIFIPALNLAIEFNGLYYHNDQLRDSKYHLNKTRACLSQGVQLIHIYEHEWYHKQELVKSMLCSKIGKVPTSIYARKCKVITLSSAQKKLFLTKNHLHGDVRSSINLGLLYEDTLVCVLTLGKPRFSDSHEWEIIRFANLLNTSVVGGFSKLFKAFISQHNPTSVLTFADRSWSYGGLYYSAGFQFISFTPPNYFYFKNTAVFPRQMFQKHKLAKILPVYSPDLSEYQNMLNNNYLRIWNSGNVKLEWKPSSK